MSTTDPQIENQTNPRRKPDPYASALEDLQVALKQLTDKHNDVLDGLLITPIWRLQSPQLPQSLLTVPDPNTADIANIITTAAKQSSSFLIEMTEDLFARTGERISNLEKEISRSKDHGQKEQ